MLRNISITLLTRILVTLAGFFAVVLNARMLGSEGVGTIGLVILAVSMIQLLNNVVGGGALIYLISRTETGLLIVISYLWSIIASLVGVLVLAAIGLLPEGFLWHVILLSVLQALSSINLSIIVGKEKFSLYNVLVIIQYFILLSILFLFYFILNYRVVYSYIYALYISYTTIYIISLICLHPHKLAYGQHSIKNILKDVFGFGLYVQLASIFQLLSSRLSYYFIELFINRAALGVFTVATQLSESVWLVGKSIATVQYSRIANTNDKTYAIKITVLFVKISFIISIALLLLMLSLPDVAFTWIFSSDFIGIQNILVALFVGTLAVSVSVIFSHFFSGNGMPKYNMIASAIGCAVTLISGYFLVPRFGLEGAGIAVSLASASAMLFQLILFLRINRLNINVFWISKEDIGMVKNEWRKLQSK